MPEDLFPPITRKDDGTIFSDMRAPGCQLKSFNLTPGDGTKADVKTPIK